MKKHLLAVLVTTLIFSAASLFPGFAEAAGAAEASPAYGESKNTSVENADVRIRLTSGDRNITVKWNKVRRAAGYQIYRAAKENGKFKRIATVRKKGRLRYTNKNLKSKKTYYYKVRAFHKAGGKTIYSPFSEVKSKTVRTLLQIRADRFINKATKPSMTKQQKLRACYKYMRDHYRYINRQVVETGAKGWVNRYASRFFKDGGGNCCSWAAAYTTVAKRLGFPATAVSGKIYYANGKLWGRHGWTEIKMDGKTYVFDPEIEYSYRKRGTKLNLYKIKALDNGWFLYKRR